MRRFSSLRGENKGRKRRISRADRWAKLQTLIESCVYEARRLSLKELKQHNKRSEIEPDNYVQITEGIIERLEEQCKEVKAGCSRMLLNSSMCLYNHARRKENVPCIQSTYSSMRMYQQLKKTEPTTDEYLHALDKDNFEHRCPSTLKSFCPGLSDVSKHLWGLKRTLESLA